MLILRMVRLAIEMTIIIAIWYYFSKFVEIQRQKRWRDCEIFSVKNYVIIYLTYVLLVANALYFSLQAVIGSLILTVPNNDESIIYKVYNSTLTLRIVIMFSNSFMILYLFFTQGRTMKASLADKLN